ncbi:MAG: hypothetical protein WAM94_08985 [Chromatiaceae bacterium]
MPKEKIRDESGVLAQIAWSHDQYVQVATLHTDPPTFIAWCRDLVARVDEAKAAHTAASVPHLSDPERLFDSESMGMFWTPNRYQINELIRVLRRARDQAFGRDE